MLRRRRPRASPRPPRLAAVDVLDGDIARRIVAEAAAPVERSHARCRRGGRSRSQWTAVRAALQDAPPDDPMTARLRGLPLLSQEDYAAAAATLGPGVRRITPITRRSAFVLGWARIGAGDRIGAVTAFGMPRCSIRRWSPAHLALAETYVALGQPALAGQAVEAGLQGQPQSVELQRAGSRAEGQESLIGGGVDVRLVFVALALAAPIDWSPAEQVKLTSST